MQKVSADIAALLQAGLAHHAAGRPADALAAFARAAERAPAVADAHYLSGAVLAQLGRAAEAVGPLERAAALGPAVAAYRATLAQALAASGRVDAAKAAFAHVPAPDADAHFAFANALAPHDPDGAEAHWRLAAGHPGAALNLGNALARRESWAEALAMFERAPGLPAALVGAGACLIALDRAAEAVRRLEAALAKAPGDPAAWLNFGIARAATGDFDAALAAYDRAGDAPAVRAARAAALSALHRYAEAAALLEPVVSAGPENFEALLNLGVAEAGRGRYVAARARFEAALALRPGSAKALANLANAILYCGDAAGARPFYARALAAAPGDPATVSSSLYALCYDDALPAADLRAAHRDWGRGHPPPKRPVRRAGSARIKVGYVSGDFCRHSCAYVLAAVLPHHDRAAFEIVAYSNTPREDAMTETLKAHLDGFVRIVGEGDAALAARVAADGVDVLVDLSGHTQGNRLGLFARRPAPVQLSWLGYPASTGLAQIDARVTDALADPDGPDADAPLVRLQDGFLAFAPPDGPSPAREPGPPVFASFNNVAKLGPRTVACWAAILRAVPEARLLLKALSFEDPGIAARYRGLFEGHCIDPARVECVGWIGEPGGHLALYSRIDVALDPFPYNGTLTTLEALWAGVPVVTLAGDRHSARVGTSILTRIGRADLVAADEDAYVRLAAETLARGTDRAALRAALVASPLMDGEKLARGLEAAYRDFLRDVS